MIDRCIFCDLERERSEGHVLYESLNFYVEPVLFGAFAPGHVLLISKFHIRCFGDMPENYRQEFLSVLDMTRRKVEDAFSPPFFSEMGVYGQSVKHAHLHLFPSITEQYHITSLISHIPEDVITSEIAGLAELAEIYHKEGEYITIYENGQLYACHTKGYQGEAIRLRDLFVKVTGLTEFLNWQTMPQELQTKNREWSDHTKRVFKQQ
ncbi:MAG: HIT family protein [bacterium]